MLLSIAVIIIVGMVFGGCCKKVKLPGLLGFMLAGIVLGPYTLNWIDQSVLNISEELRKMALVIILLRAGLSLNIQELKKVGRPALFMCFLPACFEMSAMLLFAPKLLGITYLEAGIMGAVVAAVSPAVIVPKMIKIMEQGYGTNKQIPQMILGGASVDDVFVIVVFTAFIGAAKGGVWSPLTLLKIPISVVSGVVAGAAAGYVLVLIFRKIHMRDTVKVLLILAVAFIFVALEEKVTAVIPFAALLGVMGIGLGMKKIKESVAVRLSIKFNKIWVPAEVMLFVLVGATVNLKYVELAGLSVVLLILCVLVFRSIGVYCCMIGTNLNGKERLFCVIAYLPKATVQAAIGGVALSEGLACGNIVLAVAVVAIIITAPLGDFLIELFYKKLLEQ